MTLPASIRLIVSDIDGVWTDGKVIYAGDTQEIKEFNIRDGLGVKIAQKAGIVIAAVTSRSSRALERRCSELGITHLVQSATSKLDEMRRIALSLQIPLEEVCYIGDDLLDLAAIKATGFSAAPADAVQEVRAAASVTLQSRGGQGAIRELVELILRARGDWDRIVSEFGRESVASPNV